MGLTHSQRRPKPRGPSDRPAATGAVAAHSPGLHSQASPRGTPAPRAAPGSPAQPPALFQLKAVHEQLAALSQAPVNKPKRKKEKKEKERKKKDKDKDRHKAKSEEEKKAKAAPPAKQAPQKKAPTKKASSTAVASRWAADPRPGRYTESRLWAGGACPPAWRGHRGDHGLGGRCPAVHGAGLPLRC